MFDLLFSQEAARADDVFEGAAQHLGVQFRTDKVNWAKTYNLSLDNRTKNLTVLLTLMLTNLFPNQVSRRVQTGGDCLDDPAAGTKSSGVYQLLMRLSQLQEITGCDCRHLLPF